MDDDLKHLMATMRQENAIAHEETRRHFDVTTKRVEKRFDLLAETVQHVHEQLPHTRASLGEKIERSAAETQAMITFSHQELDWSITALEDGQRMLKEKRWPTCRRAQRILI